MNDIVIRGLSKSFGEKTVLRDYHATLPAGRVTCVMGPSGCGKTTLARVLLGLLAPNGGSVSGLPERLSAVFQEDRLCADFRAAANVRLAAAKGVSPAEIRACLSELGLADGLEKPVRELSGGMKRRVAIARALLADYDFLVLDEPFKGLDEATKSAVIGVVRAKTAGKTVLLVTHDAEEARAMGAEIIRMEPVQ